ncbi:MAG: SMC-Scp complex subunit ScpB [Candidatus Acidiferrales bacterium]
MTPQEIQAGLEAIIYAADEPATLDQIAKALGIEKPEARAALDQLTATYQTEDRGIEVRKVAGGWKFYTKAQHHDVVRKFIKSLQPPLRLTMPALETLAVIAYKQPVTVPEINEIRGVHVGGVIKTLLEKRLITTAGRKEVIGRPILYRTSKQFMMRFGLSDLDELPSLKEFEALAQAALGSDEGIAEVQPEDQPEDQPEVQAEGQPEAQAQGQPANQDGSADATDSANDTEVAATTSSTATEAQARGEDEKDSTADASAEQEAESEHSETPAQIAAETFAESPEAPASTTATPQASTDESDKSRAAAASSSPHSKEPSA